VNVIMLAITKKRFVLFLILLCSDYRLTASSLLTLREIVLKLILGFIVSNYNSRTEMSYFKTPISLLISFK
jgi:hypothetical protein